MKRMGDVCTETPVHFSVTLVPIDYRDKIMFSILLTLILMSITASRVFAAFPHASISNGFINAHVYLPDPDSGYYQGTRFDWSGVVYSLVCNDHEYFGEWQYLDDPLVNNRVTGPVDSFEPVGYKEARVGETFVRFGIGVLKKPEEKEFRWTHTYKIVDHGVWTVEQGGNWIEFEQTVANNHTRYPFTYTKRITATPGLAELVIDHRLVNTGDRTFITEVYNHNFFVIDGQSTGPDFVVRFPFEPSFDGDLKGYATSHGKELIYLKKIPMGEDIITHLKGFSSRADHHRFAIENTKTKAGVRMIGDRGMSKLIYWSPATTLCPEPFIDINIPPGQADRWALRYEFYTVE